MEFDLENPLTGIVEHQPDTIPSLFTSELDHMPCKDFNISIRLESISLILHAQYSGNLDRSVAYLAINYLDRFISKQKLPGEEQFIFDSQTIERAELMILGALKWRMRSITPFSFIHFFLSLFKLQDPLLQHALKARASDIIYKSQHEIKLLKFRPSIVTASALLEASHELFPLQFSSFRNTICSCSYVNNEKLMECGDVMNDMVMDGYDSVIENVSSSHTPVNVLDQHWSSSESDMTTSTVTTGCMRSERDLKRRKISDFCGNKTFQFSQIQHC
ncbi:hypothetical protein IFM89_003424 [Coptis chinensis]|uniref:Cyclin C-terminal domain-containing protein n=1 Tax=Coptis chinensis TaxID=261450 RepID=A0A835LAR7_9MAGN|nr:hypothetical protein IFM89_003424 [Coptis chinensis]